MLTHVVASIPVLISVLVYYVYFYRSYTLQTPNDLNPQYDYIIVGGGTAGSVLAARLSEDAQQTVLVLEAGSDHWTHPLAHIPAAVPFLQLNDDLDWQYRTVEQQNGCFGMINRQSQWPRGKCLGGSSMLNYMLYTRADPADFRHWPPAWSYDAMLPYYRRSENVQVEELKGQGNHGTSGPVEVSQPSPPSELAQAMLRGFEEVGFKQRADVNSGKFEGVSYNQLFVSSNGRRQSAALTYLQPAMRASNSLHVVTGAQVSRILLDQARKAVGVQYLHGGKEHRVLINKEVLLAAGAIASPQLLMLSGIGDDAELKKMKIEPVVHLPAVGRNLADHVLTELQFGFDPAKTQAYPLREMLSNPLHAAKALAQYALLGTGPLSTHPFEVAAYESSGILDDRSADIQYFGVSATPALQEMQPAFNMNNETFESCIGQGIGKYSASLTAAIMHPHSRGTVRLRSNRITDAPLIDPRYFDDQRDVKAMVYGMKQLLRVSQSNALKSTGFYLLEKPLPGCSQHSHMSDAYLECSARHRTYTLYHPTGTCAMGDRDSGVVDDELRVHGVGRLRVVDASVIPSPLTTNPAATVIALAEKAVDLIRGK